MEFSSGEIQPAKKFVRERAKADENLERAEETENQKMEVIRCLCEAYEYIGPDEIHAELPKVIAEQGGKVLRILTGQIPLSWLKSTFIALPKKAGAADCDDHGMISLMSYVLKVFLRIIYTWIAEM